MLKTLKAVLKDESGVTIIEYGLIAALVAVAAVAILGTMGGDLSAKFTAIDGNLK